MRKIHKIIILKRKYLHEIKNLGYLNTYSIIKRTKLIYGYLYFLILEFTVNIILNFKKKSMTFFVNFQLFKETLFFDRNKIRNIIIYGWITFDIQYKLIHSQMLDIICICSSNSAIFFPHL